MNFVIRLNTGNHAALRDEEGKLQIFDFFSILDSIAMISQIGFLHHLIEIEAIMWRLPYEQLLQIEYNVALPDRQRLMILAIAHWALQTVIREQRAELARAYAIRKEG
jgi:hypothetical protein